ncbi:dCTP deaminase [Eggerthella sinensis]|uniref:dCTP deaminase n=1 Tax=Eggerthella sinensis TaxID=242230 RepID=UPI0022E54C26|nr:dCTP deaminase [Eggerthella sinensis]
MILSDITIEKLLAEGSLAIEPLEPAQIQPASVDIRLGDTFSIVEDTPSGIVGLEDEIAYKTIRTDRYILLPGQFVLATTMEYVRLGNDLTAFVEGRSSLGRMGLFVQNAGWVDPGFEGEITLELFNANRCALELRTGRRVGQLVFAQLDEAAKNPYAGKYQGSAARRDRACSSTGKPAASVYSMSERISPGSSPASRNFLRVTKFHTMTRNVAPIFTMR